MASILVTSVAAYYGGLPGYLGASIAMAYLFPTQSKTVGPRLNDLTIQTSTYGVPIPIGYGTVRVAGNVIHSTNLVETRHKKKTKSGKIITYTYSVTCAVAICEGPIIGVRRIWANSRLIYDVSASNSGNTGETSALVIHTGSETQNADSILEAHWGAGNVPGYRGMAYVVFQDLQLERYGNRIPNFTFEVVLAGTATASVEYYHPYHMMDSMVYVSSLDELWVSADKWDDTESYIQRVDPATGSVIAGIGVGTTYISIYTPMVYDAIGDAVFTYSGGTSKITKIDCATLAVTTSAAGLGFSMAGLWVNPVTGALLQMINFSANLKLINKTALTVTSTITTSYQVNQLVADATGNMYYVRGNYGGSVSSVYKLDAVTYGETLIYTHYKFLQEYGGMTYDPSRNALFICSYDSGGANQTIVRLDLATNTIGADIASPYITFVIDTMVYDTTRDLIWTSNGSGASAYPHSILAIDPDTGALTKTYSGLVSYPGLLIVNATYPDVFAIGTGGDGFNEIIKVGDHARITPADVYLSEIITSLCGRVDVPSGDLSFSRLTDSLVKGYVVGKAMSARAAIEPLQSAYYFDAVESDGKLAFVTRGGAAAVTIDGGDLGATADSGNPSELLTITDTDELELPQKVTVSYPSLAQDYQICEQHAMRVSGDSINISNLQLPIVMTEAKAADVAAVTLYNAWTSRRRYQMKLGRKYSLLEPTDVINVSNNGITHALRIFKKEEAAPGIISVEAVSEKLDVYVQPTDGADLTGDDITQSVTVPPDTVMVLMDIPSLRDADADSGFYAAVSANQSSSGYDSWQGCEAFKSTDSGTSYSSIGDIDTQAVIGVTNNALGNWTGGLVFDETNTLTVGLYGGETLSTVTEADVLNGANMAVVGNSTNGFEVIQFKRATLVSANTYTISGLLRGLRGTELAMSTHNIGDAFVLVDSATWIRAESDSSEFNLMRLYKAVTYDLTLDDASAQNFTNTGAGLKPYAPCHLGGGRDGSGNITINWIRRNRTNGVWLDYIDVPMTEATESYEIEVWTAGYATLKRTITATTQTATYSAADQTTDFGGTQSTVYLRIYQISATVGRGYKLEGTL